MKQFINSIEQRVIMGAPSIIVVLSNLLFCLLLVCAQTSSAELSKGFYGNSCSNVEQLVRSAVELKFQQTFVTAPATLRLFFHDCFVRVYLISDTSYQRSDLCLTRVDICVSDMNTRFHIEFLFLLNLWTGL